MPFDLKKILGRVERAVVHNLPAHRALHERVAALEHEVRSLQDQLHHIEARAAAEAATVAEAARDRVAFDDACLDRFRGPREVIVARMAFWIPVLAARFPAGLGGLRAVDLGCGRGEWLELLQQQGSCALGVDASPRNQAVGRERGLDVIVADVFQWLGEAPSSAFDIVGCFHLIEHFDSASQHRLFRAIHRILKPGGSVIIETPNPENLEVGARWFHLDPSHQRPLPPELLETMAKFHGFSEIATHRLHPVVVAHDGPDESPEPAQPPWPEPWHRAFFGPQDYGIIATKALETTPAGVLP